MGKWNASQRFMPILYSIRKSMRKCGKSKAKDKAEAHEKECAGPSTTGALGVVWVLFLEINVNSLQFHRLRSLVSI